MLNFIKFIQTKIERRREEKEKQKILNYLSIIISSGIGLAIIIGGYKLLISLYSYGMYAHKKINIGFLESTFEQVTTCAFFLIFILIFLVLVGIMFLVKNKNYILGTIFFHFFINWSAIILASNYLPMEIINKILFIISMLLLQGAIIKWLRKDNKYEYIRDYLNLKYIWYLFNGLLIYMCIVIAAPIDGNVFTHISTSFYIVKQPNENPKIILNYKSSNGLVIVADYSCDKNELLCENQDILVHASTTQKLYNVTNLEIERVKFNKVTYK